MSRGRIVLSVLSALVIALSTALGGLALSPAQAQGTGVLEISKSVINPQESYAPGDTFQYEIELSCSSVDGPGCDDAELTDELPEPLVLNGNPAVSVSGNIANDEYAVTEDGDAFTIDFTQDLGDGVVGMESGTDITIVVNVMVPEDAQANYGGTVTNTADATQTNGENVDASAAVTLDIPLELAATVDKTITPAGVPGIPGEPVEFTIDSSNASNASVDTMVVQDPADGADDPFEYLEVTGISSITPPEGATQVQVDWQSADGTWTDGTPTAIPDDPNALLDGITLSDIHGLRITWISEDGATIPPDASSTIVLETQTRSNVTDIPAGTDETVTNVTSTQVTLGEDESEVVTDDATVVISRADPTVTTEKTYTPANVPSGGTSTATISSTNGPIPVTEMVISDPGPGEPGFDEQDVTFEGFDADSIEWPANATEASVTYTYTEGDPTTETATEANTLPGPDPDRTVTGFEITYSGPIQQNAVANLSYDVMAPTLPDDSPGVTSTNSTSTEVTDANDTSATDDDTADLNVLPLQVDTEVTKDIVRDQMPGVPGSATVISLDAMVTGDSTIGSNVLQITDPSPQPPDSDNPPALTDFWNAMDLVSLGPVEIPTNTTLTVEYWSNSQQEWVTVESGLTSDDSPFNWTPTAEEREDIAGIRLTYEPTDPDGTLPPGFEVQPYFTVAQRDQLRDGSGSALPDDETITQTNDVQSKVDNPDSQETPRYDDDSDSIDVVPAPDGPGTDLLDKSWLNPDTGNPDDAVTVGALTDDQRDARITWGTGGFPIEQAVIADPASAGELDDVSTSVYDAFNLVEIQPINANNDPLMTFDAVTGVELYLDTNGDGDGNDPGEGWTDITETVCGADGAACDGVFPGYTLSDDEQASALGARLTFEESPTRADRITNPATDPPVGSGVANSEAASRPIDLTFQIRQTLRSDPDQPVLGTQHPEVPYNTGQPGLVDNTASLTPDDYAPSTDDARITITDSAVNTELTKEFDTDAVGLPPADGGTDPSDYPLVLATLTATNTTPAKVSNLQVTDAVDTAQQTSNTFDVFNLQQIVSISVPTAADPALSEVFLTENGTEGEALTIDEALALSESDLADVTQIRVLHHSPDGTLVAIEPDAQSVVELSMRLRPDHRSDGSPVQVGEEVLNIAQTDVSSPEDDASANADDTVTIQEATYGVEADKTIDPAERFENESRDYTIHLQGQPTGNVRTRVLTITDTEETFWNAFDFTSFDAVATPAPVAQIKTDALVGVTYELDADGAPVAMCDGSTDLADCWVDGDWTDTGGSIVPELPDGVSAGDVRGLRFSFQNADGTGWERPPNPIVPVEFTATMRDTLIIGPNGEDNTVPVPTTEPGQPTAPGEEEQGRTTDTVDVHGEGTFGTPGGGVYEADDAATDSTLRRHLTNEVSITKAPGNGNGEPPSYLPDSNIPYEFTVENTGTWPQTGVTITDQIQTNDNGSMLVEPRDSDGDPAPDYTFTLVDADGNPKSTDGFSAELDEDTGVLTVTPPDDFVFEPGDVLTVETPLIYQPGLEPGTEVENGVTTTDDRTYDTCEWTQNETIENTDTNVDACAASTVTQPLAASPLRVTKSVKGVGAGLPDAAPGDANYDDLGRVVSDGTDVSECDAPNAPNDFYVYPCEPITRPGGTERWQLRLTNSGNTTATILAGIDVLPHPGDTGVIVPTERESEWTPTLLGNFTTDGEPVDLADDFVSFYYLTTVPDQACNQADILSDTDPDWSAATYPDCYDEVESRNWVRVNPDTTPAELAQAKAIKGVIDYTDSPTGGGLPPLATVSVGFDTQTPWTPDMPGELPPTPIAWNSFAAGATAFFNGEPNPTNVIEPRKVGVATATGQLALEKVVDVPDGFPDDALPDSYPMQLACTSGPEDVDIVDADGNDQSQVTVPPDETVAVNDDGTLTIPWGADCTATEDPVPPGATVTWDPPGTGTTSGAVDATRDFADRDDIAEPAWPDPIDPATIQATNTYEVGGFTISKEVDESGAVDQDGNPITYDTDYDFTATCTYDNGEENVTVLDETFTLADGADQAFDNLPAGSECTVTEIGTGGAASTSVVALPNGTPSGDGTSAEFTIEPDEGDAHVNTVDFTNHYTVGSVNVTKALDGAGVDDWATEPFEVEMVCTLDGATPDPVFEDTHTFTPPFANGNSDTWTVNNLPTGAECAVTETETGGANDTSIAGSPITVGNGSTPPQEATVTVTNTFLDGQVRARKVIAGLEGQQLEQARDHTYTFSLACTREVDGETEDVDIPGGATRDVTPSESPVAIWDGLPVGASCEVTEVPDSQFPDTVDVIVVPDTVTVRNGRPVAQATVVNVFDEAPLTVEKLVTGDASEYAADEFGVEVECSYGDVPLNVDPQNPDAEPGPYDFTLAPDESFTTAELPVGSDCTVTETDTGNATSTTITGDGEVPITGDGATATIENRYDNTGFVIDKMVDAGGAVDANGDPVTYNVDYTFDATCEFNGQTVLDTEITVHAGESQQLDGVPVGADCTVTETDTGGAKDTAMQITQDGETTPGDGTSATFTLTAGTTDLDTVTATNAYGAGDLLVKKVVTGPGADDATGPYELRVRCTLDDASLKLVRDERHELQAGETWTVDDLPADAQCTVTEPKKGGADEVTIDPGTVTVADGKTVTVRATNTFGPDEGGDDDGRGDLQITKVVDGKGADDATGPYTLRARCTVDDASPKVVRNKTHQLEADETWILENLPARAQCTVTEPDNGGADEVAIEPGTVTVRDNDSVLVRATNTFGPHQGDDDDDDNDNDDDDDLPDTGGPINPIWVVLSILAIGVGGMAIRRSRRLS
ncbi:DUF5979 domain-containing protein [Solicola gregarius]|uniref:DUF5979 domain-containing protein n=1 Tax=Solicola gregarius TaxID=2908642 RepID=A0AA46TDX5_9ACTN|nr:DUF5979 domain-containing protein [Solicola gregarius]UYM03378.1 DUF5979 domain-containing protein [Solicola gregarius]